MFFLGTWMPHIFPVFFFFLKYYLDKGKKPVLQPKWLMVFSHMSLLPLTHQWVDILCHAPYPNTIFFNHLSLISKGSGLHPQLSLELAFKEASMNSAVVFKLGCVSGSTGRLVCRKHTWLASFIPGVSDAVGLEWNLRTWFWTTSGWYWCCWVECDSEHYWYEGRQPGLASGKNRCTLCCSKACAFD